MTATSILKIRTATLFAARECASKDDLRHNLKGIHFRNGDTRHGVHFCSCDGHTLLTGNGGEHEGHPLPDDGIIVPTHLLPRGSSREQRHTIIEYDHQSGDLKVTDPKGNTVLGKAIGGKYPQYQDILPAGDDGIEAVSEIGMSAEVFERINKALRIFGAGSRVTSRVRFRGSLNPVEFIASVNGQKVTGIAMPCRPD